MFMTKPIATHSHDASKWNLEFPASRWNAGQQPGHFAGVREAEDEFVDDTVDADGAGDEGQGGVGGVGEDEVVRVEGG